MQKAEQREGVELAAWLSRIEAMHPSEIDMGLDRVNVVKSRLAISRVATQQVVIGGTNGKGSTVALIDTVARRAGYRVATYTSPHVYRYNERICVDGEPVDDRSLVRAFEAVERARGNVPLTYFEFGTLAAFVIMAQAELDLAILEVGLGGRLDAVNVIDADLAVITSIGLDHIDWLGDDELQIAREKAGIMRPQQIALVGETFPETIARECMATLEPKCVWQVGSDFGFMRDQDSSCFKEAQTQDLIADVQVPESLLLPRNNVALALQALCCLREAGGLNRLPELPAAARDLSAVRLTGRLQRVMQGNTPVFVDVGHNPQAARYLAQFVQSVRAGRPVYTVFSCLADKDIAGVVGALHAEVDSWFLAPLDVPRARPLPQIESALASVGAITASYDDVAQALENCLAAAEESGAMILAFGSFVMVEKVLLGLAEREPSPDVCLRSQQAITALKETDTTGEHNE